MHILITGATGQLGRFIAARLKQDGHEITALGRTPTDDPADGFIRWDLEPGEVAVLPSADALVHCALAHEPGKYRGGEGDDPHAFIRLNFEGSQAVFEAAKAAGIRHVVFLSSRAVYKETGNWTVLTETAETEPDTLYGKVKLACEEGLHSLCDAGFLGTSLRVTGVYGTPPGLSTHKWAGMFADFAAGKAVIPRISTEVHGEDLAAAVALVLDQGKTRTAPFEVYNVSDQLLDREDLIRLYRDHHGGEGLLPVRAPGPLGVMDVGKLVHQGWAPGGKARLEAFVRDLAAPGHSG